MSAAPTFAERLASARERQGLNRNELADRLGTTYANIYSYESGKSQPSVDRLAVLCRALEISADELLGIEKREDPPELSGERHVSRPIERDLPNRLLAWRRAAGEVRARLEDPAQLKLIAAADEALDALLCRLLPEVIRLGAGKS